jgi:Mrp family chromosome partitioning ATPase
MGYKVGIFDSDIYGPSLPTLINKEKEILTPR